MQAAELTIAEFKRRRTATWRATRWWLLVLAATGGYFVYGAKRDPRDFSIAMIVTFALMMMSTLAIIFAVNRLYKCPACEKVPMANWTSFGVGSISFNRGVELRPTVCGHCGARLAPLRSNISLQRDRDR
jgi:hypothetical protein